MLKRKHPPSKLLTLGAMVTSLSVLCLFAASVFNVARVPLIIFASFCIYVLTCEGAYLIAFASFFASLLLSFFIVLDKTIVYVFALLPGHYGIIRTLLHEKVESRPLRFLLKLIYSDLCAALGIYLALEVFGIALALPVSVWVIVLVLQTIFIVYDLFFGVAAAIYENRLRRLLLPRR